MRHVVACHTHACHTHARRDWSAPEGEDYQPISEPPGLSVSARNPVPPISEPPRIVDSRAQPPANLHFTTREPPSPPSCVKQLWLVWLASPCPLLLRPRPRASRLAPRASRPVPRAPCPAPRVIAPASPFRMALVKQSAMIHAALAQAQAQAQVQAKTQAQQAQVLRPRRSQVADRATAGDQGAIKAPSPGSPPTDPWANPELQKWGHGLGARWGAVGVSCLTSAKPRQFFIPGGFGNGGYSKAHGLSVLGGKQNITNILSVPSTGTQPSTQPAFFHFAGRTERPASSRWPRAPMTGRACWPRAHDLRRLSACAACRSGGSRHRRPLPVSLRVLRNF
jgi:hypothetical protein